MSELMPTAQYASSVFTDCFRIRLDKMNGNVVTRAAQPERSTNLTSKLLDISADDVREELECILDSPEFANKPMLSRFFRHVVEETLAGRAHEIKGYTIATEVFGRRKDFDSTIDPIVRIQAGRLRRALESYHSGRGRQNQLRIEIGKGSYVPTFSRRNAEEMPMGDSRQSAPMILPERERSQQLSGASRFPTKYGPSIAVMPLVNMTNASDQEYLTSGLTEELMSELWCCNGPLVSLSHATTQWNGKPFGARQPGYEPGVRFFLEGSLRKEGQTIKLTLRLIDTATLIQIWGEQYKRDLEPGKMFALQEEIARSVAESIGRLMETITQKFSTEFPDKCNRRS